MSEPKKSAGKSSKPGKRSSAQGKPSGKERSERSASRSSKGPSGRPAHRDESGAGKKTRRPSRPDARPDRGDRRGDGGDGGDRSASGRPTRGQSSQNRSKPFGAGGKTQRGGKKKGGWGPKQAKQEGNLGGDIRLNKFIAHAGFCSRREADTYIEEGKVQVNGEKVTEHGIKVRHTDDVRVNGQSISLEPFVYILLNKAKDTISTTDDERGRNTVLDAVEDATGYRVYPVGRLDRHTMGLLILTNDGDLAHRLMHPSHKVQKVYEVTTSVVLTDQQLTELASGIELEDGPVKPQKVSRDGMDPKKVTITVLEGRNHLIRRITAYFGADVVKLKRVKYAGLNPEDLRVGRWRYLRAEEVNNLRKLVKLNTLDFNKQSE